MRHDGQPYSPPCALRRQLGENDSEHGQEQAERLCAKPADRETSVDALESCNCETQFLANTLVLFSACGEPVLDAPSCVHEHVRQHLRAFVKRHERGSSVLW